MLLELLLPALNIRKATTCIIKFDTQTNFRCFVRILVGRIGGVRRPPQPIFRESILECRALPEVQRCSPSTEKLPQPQSEKVNIPTFHVLLYVLKSLPLKLTSVKRLSARNNGTVPVN